MSKEVKLSEAAEGLKGIKFPFFIGQDGFIEKKEDRLTDDLHQELRNLARSKCSA